MLHSKIDTLLSKLGDYSKFVIIIVTIFLGVSLFRNYSSLNSYKDRITEARERVEELQRENDRLQRDLKEVESEEFIERELRNKMNMAKEGEIVVILPDEEILRKLAPERVEEEETLPPPNWEKWLSLFL